MKAGFASNEIATAVGGRACGRCSLCCKLLRIDELAKPVGTWCTHCKPGNGCKIYDKRPLECERFLCLWLTTAELDDAWHPPTAKLVAYLEGDGNRIAIHVDPGFPIRWRQEPYYSRIKQWAYFAVDNNAQVVVYIKNRAIVVLPNKEIDLGEFGPGDHIMVGELQVPFGRDWGAYLGRAQDIPEEQRGTWVKRGPHKRDG